MFARYSTRAATNSTVCNVFYLCELYDGRRRSGTQTERAPEEMDEGELPCYAGRAGRIVSPQRTGSRKCFSKRETINLRSRRTSHPPPMSRRRSRKLLLCRGCPEQEGSTREFKSSPSDWRPQGPAGRFAGSTQEVSVKGERETGLCHRLSRRKHVVTLLLAAHPPRPLFPRPWNGRDG